MIDLSNGNLQITLCEPGTFYRGTRFDWNAVFRSISCDGLEFSGLWFDGSDPLRHDNLSGCSEEFAPVWVDSTHCLKPGVGLLSVPEGMAGYDRFKLYEMVDSGHRDVDSDGKCAHFTHLMDGYYEYVKTVSATGPDSFEIAHDFRWKSDIELSGNCYNHNFFTFGKSEVGPSRCMIFDGEPSGEWRADSVNAFIRGKEIRFERVMNAGEKSFMGSLTLPGLEGKPYHFRICEGDSYVDVSSDAPMDHAVFWSNERVSCVEPYVMLSGGNSFLWKIRYELKR